MHRIRSEQRNPRNWRQEEEGESESECLFCALVFGFRCFTCCISLVRHFRLWVFTPVSMYVLWRREKEKEREEMISKWVLKYIFLNDAVGRRKCPGKSGNSERCHWQNRIILRTP